MVIQFRNFCRIRLIKRRSGRRNTLVLLGMCILASCWFFEMYYRINLRTEIIYDGNYFESSRETRFWIRLSGCVIPWKTAPLRQLSNSSGPSRAECIKGRPKLTYVKENVIYGLPKPSINVNNMECCYRGISRLFGSDDRFQISESCQIIDLHGGTAVTEYSGVVVECVVSGYKYKDIHPIILKVRKEGRMESPNIVILGLDSVPRYNFHHYMPKTRRLLEGLDTFDFFGYMKVGENTFPNMIPLLTGYQEDQVLKFCYSRDLPIDFCPFLWQDIRMSTAILEDSPGLAIFNYAKFGFLNAPSDHYLRPLMLVASKMYNEFHYSQLLFPCVGSTPVEEFVLNHMKALLEADTPLFSFTWLTTLAHEDITLLSYADELLSSWLATLNTSNTILILMSDHGQRFSGERTTFNGWYNAKLPFLTITLPPQVKFVLGKLRLGAMRTNTRRLTTPFDVYQTLVDILKIYNLKDFENMTNSEEKRLTVAKPSVKRLYGQSLFLKIQENRTCEDAGIPGSYCACANLQPIDVHEPILEEAARAGIEKINSQLPRRCRSLKLSRVIAGAREPEGDVIVGFTAWPGEFRFEAFMPADKNLSNLRLDRTDKIHGVWCTSDFFFELYCYCDYVGFLLEFILGNRV